MILTFVIDLHILFEFANLDFRTAKSDVNAISEALTQQSPSCDKRVHHVIRGFWKANNVLKNIESKHQWGPICILLTNNNTVGVIAFTSYMLIFS